jgi:hypothetical protein
MGGMGQAEKSDDYALSHTQTDTVKTARADPYAVNHQRSRKGGKRTMIAKTAKADPEGQAHQVT